MKKEYISPDTLVRQLGLQTIVCGSPLQTHEEEADPDKTVRGRRRRNQWGDEEEEDEEAW